MDTDQTGTRRRSTTASGRLAAVVLALVLGAGFVAACSSSDDSSSSTTTTAVPTEPPNLVGTWTSEYTYPWNADDGTPEVVNATERLIIEHQEGGLIWGIDEYVDNGETIRIPVRGAVDVHGELTLGEENGSFRGQLQPDATLIVHFVRTDDQFTAFTARLTRS